MSTPINMLLETVCVYLIGCICCYLKKKKHTNIPSESTRHTQFEITGAGSNAWRQLHNIFFLVR